MKNTVVVVALFACSMLFADANEPLILSMQKHKFGEVSANGECVITTPIDMKYNLFSELRLNYTKGSKKLWSMMYVGRLHKAFDAKGIQNAMSEVSKQVELDHIFKFQSSPRMDRDGNVETIYLQEGDFGKYRIRLSATRFHTSDNSYDHTYISFGIADMDIYNGDCNKSFPDSLFNVNFGEKVNSKDFREKNGRFIFSPKERFCKFSKYWAEASWKSRQIFMIAAETDSLKNPTEEFLNVCKEIEKMYHKPLVHLQGKPQGAFTRTASLTFYENEDRCIGVKFSVFIGIKRKANSIFFSATDRALESISLKEFKADKENQMRTK